MTSELIDKEKEIARSWFRELRDRFCKKFDTEWVKALE